MPDPTERSLFMTGCFGQPARAGAALSLEAAAMSAFDQHHRDLSALATATRRRALIARQGVDFASNDYLALGQSGRCLLYTSPSPRD